MGEDVKLDYCQSDRDMLRDTHKTTKAVLSVLTTHTAEDAERFEKTDERLEKLENWQARITGAIGLAGFALGLVAKHFGAFPRL